MSLIEAKKILLGLVGLHALRRMHGMSHLHHMHKLVTYYMPLRYAADAWKAYGKVSATAPHLPSIIKGADHHKTDHKVLPQKVVLTADQSYDLDKWLNHYFPEDVFDHNYY